jgi:hypothetical protein
MKLSPETVDGNRPLDVIRSSDTIVHAAPPRPSFRADAPRDRATANAAPRRLSCGSPLACCSVDVWSLPHLSRYMRWVRLTKKLAAVLDGVDVSRRRVGEVFELPSCEADLLIAEGWAEARFPAVAQRDDITDANAAAAGPGPAPTRRLDVQRLRQMRAQMERRHLVDQNHRRAEDRIREELRDARAKTIRAS